MGSKCIAIHPALLYCIMSHLRLALRVHDPAISTDSPVMDIVMDTCTCPPPSPEVLVALHGAVAKRRRNCVTSTILTPWLSSPDTNFTLLFMQGRVDVWEGGLLSALPACTLTKMKEVVSPTLLLPWFPGVWDRVHGWTRRCWLTGKGTGVKWVLYSEFNFCRWDLQLLPNEWMALPMLGCINSLQVLRRVSMLANWT